MRDRLMAVLFVPIFAAAAVALIVYAGAMIVFAPEPPAGESGGAH